MTRRRTERIPFSFKRTGGVFDPPGNAFSHLVSFSEFARPMSPEYADGEAVLEPWVLSVACSVTFFNAGGFPLGVTDYEGLALEAMFLDYDYARLVKSNTEPKRTDDFKFARAKQTIAQIESPSVVRRTFYASNGTSDGYPVSRQVVPDAAPGCQTQRTYYFPLALTAKLDPTATGGTIPSGGLPDNFTFLGEFLVDHEWRWRTI